MRDNGIVRAYVVVPVINLRGDSRVRRVLIGVEHVDLTEARQMLETARKTNDSYHVQARFTVDL